MPDPIARRYLRFAETEAAGRSPLYEAVARHVASSPEALAFLARLPPDRQQPNLLFAATRLMAGTPSGVADFAERLREHGAAIADVMRRRTTQTNEPGRCAALLPALARIAGPLALIEVGASAGLCLLPDAYGYDWGRQCLPPPNGGPAFPCEASAGTPLPTAHPEIVWRAGLDLHPLDLADAEDVAWLELLVWPEHADRLDRLRAAIKVARHDPPRVVAGDLTRDLPDLIAAAPRDATLVVFHSAVLSYLPLQDDRDAFVRTMARSGAVWLSNEAPGVFPQFAHRLEAILPNRFLLTEDGRPIAWTGPHGQSIEWIAPPCPPV